MILGIMYLLWDTPSWPRSIIILPLCVCLIRSLPNIWLLLIDSLSEHLLVLFHNLEALLLFDRIYLAFLNIRFIGVSASDDRVFFECVRVHLVHLDFRNSVLCQIFLVREMCRLWRYRRAVVLKLSFRWNRSQFWYWRHASRMLSQFRFRRFRPLV